MGGRDILKDKLRHYLQKINPSHGNNGNHKKTRYLLIIALIGILLIVISNVFSSLPDKESLDETERQIEGNHNQSEKEAIETSILTEVDDLEKNYEKELKTMLERIEGVSDVEVMVNLDSTNVKVYEKNLIIGQQETDESDQNGGIRKVEDSTEESQVVLIRQGDQEVPILTQTKKPDVRGVFIVAQGADHATTKKWIKESTASVLDVPTHRVSVMPKK